MQLIPGHSTLPCGLPVQTKHLPQLVLPGRPWPIDLVPKDQDGAVAQLLVGQQGLQLYFALPESDLRD